MADELITTDELLSKIDHRPSGTGWMDTPVDIRKGMYCYASNPKSVETLSLPNARAWNPLDDDWKLPDNWKQILLEGFRERLEKFRSFKVFMDNLCALRGVRRQVSFLYRYRRSQEHAGAQGGVVTQCLPQRLHQGRQDPGTFCRCPTHDPGCP